VSDIIPIQLAAHSLAVAHGVTPGEFRYAAIPAFETS
jgi:hypothetical protein